MSEDIWRLWISYKDARYEQERSLCCGCFWRRRWWVSQGCVVAAVGAAAAGRWLMYGGICRRVEAARIDEVYEASLAAMEELEIPVISKSKDALSATITGRDAADKKITIKLKADGPKIPTELSIRIGMFGSETKSLRIHQTIKEHL